MRPQRQAETGREQANHCRRRSDLNSPIVEKGGRNSISELVAPRLDRLSAKMASDIVRELSYRRIPLIWILLQRTNQNCIQVAAELMLPLAVFYRETGKTWLLITNVLDR